jgi:hypothetical protein
VLIVVCALIGMVLAVPGVPTWDEVRLGAVACLGIWLVAGAAAAWGQSTYGVTTIPEAFFGARQLAAGCDHALALSHDGTVFAWGFNSTGQCNVPASLTDVAAIASTLKNINVRFERWEATKQFAEDADDATIEAAYKADIERIKQEGGSACGMRRYTS